MLDELRKMMTFEGYIDPHSTQLLDSLSQQLQHNINKDLDTFRKEIELSLTQEIAQRYYFQRGNIIVGLRNEPVTTAAIELLQSIDKYNKMLSPIK